MSSATVLATNAPKAQVAAQRGRSTGALPSVLRPAASSAAMTRSAATDQPPHTLHEARSGLRNREPACVELEWPRSVLRVGRLAASLVLPVALRARLLYQGGHHALGAHASRDLVSHADPLA